MTESTANAQSPSLRIDSDELGWITFDDPDRPVNVLSEPVMRRLTETLDEARAASREGRIKALVLSSG